MASCPKCSLEIPVLAVECPHCGHDLLPPEKAVRTGWEYSRVADILLLVGTAASALGALFFAFMTVIFLFGLLGSYVEWSAAAVETLVGSILGFSLCMANLIVFLRVANLGKDEA